MYSLFTHNSSTILKFADDTMLVGLITNDDEAVYKEEVRDLSLKRQQDEGAYCGLQETEGRARPHSHRRGCSGASRELQVPWFPHHQQTIMVQTHTDSREEGTTTPNPP